MLITGARVALNANEAVIRDLQVRNGKISFCMKPDLREQTLRLDRYLLLPGLINAHDHLELNLFPRLGRGPYANATEWARDIHRPRESPIREHAAVPKGVRFHWGALKNLASGVTTVAHHNPPNPLLFRSAFPIRVVQRYQWAHSMAFSPDWRDRHRSTPSGAPFLMHAAEGTDRTASREIDALFESDVLDPKTVLIHGVGIEARHLQLISGGGSSLVWCPSSNIFLLSRTLRDEVFMAEIPIALGSDSALTAQGDLLDELRSARAWTSTERLYRMVTCDAARILKLPVGFGHIQEGGPADLLVIADGGAPPAQALMNSLPEMVIVGGRIVLVSDRASKTLNLSHIPKHRVHLEGRGRYLVRSSVAQLIRVTRRYLPGDLRLAGKLLTQ